MFLALKWVWCDDRLFGSLTQFLSFLAFVPIQESLLLWCFLLHSWFSCSLQPFSRFFLDFFQDAVFLCRLHEWLVPRVLSAASFPYQSLFSLWLYLLSWLYLHQRHWWLPDMSLSKVPHALTKLLLKDPHLDDPHAAHTQYIQTLTHCQSSSHPKYLSLLHVLLRWGVLPCNQWAKLRTWELSLIFPSPGPSPI